ncbi:Heat shock protein Hsp20 (fragment) (plasmid) [Cupriavidus taiwanensis]|uniref:Heat shock protein Hsp20 n=1 Tax=Cupriavidus taiwanensis TaxID=164546 RepID=A0A9Q7UWT9_9BURK
MDLDLKKWAPRNWFKKEQEEQQTASSLPVQRSDFTLDNDALMVRGEKRQSRRRRKAASIVSNAPTAVSSVH